MQYSESDYIKNLKKEQVKKEFSEMMSYIEIMSDGVDEIISNEDVELSEKDTSLLLSKIKEIKEFLGDKVIELGKSIKPVSKEDRELESIIDEIDLFLSS